MGCLARCLAPLVVLTSACVEPDDRPATWAYLHPAIIEPSCATPTCHGTLGERAGIVLQDADYAYALLVDERYVVAGSEASPLLYLLVGDERLLMPPDAPLPAVDVDLVRAWIVGGAAR